MSKNLRAIDKSAAQNKNIKEKLRRFENVFDRYTNELMHNYNSIFNSETGKFLYKRQHTES